MPAREGLFISRSILCYRRPQVGVGLVKQMSFKCDLCVLLTVTRGVQTEIPFRFQRQTYLTWCQKKKIFLCCGVMVRNGEWKVVGLIPVKSCYQCALEQSWSRGTVLSWRYSVATSCEIHRDSLVMWC